MAPDAVYQDEVNTSRWSKNEKKSPRVVNRVGKQDGQIQEFIENRNEIKNILKML